MKQSRLVAAPPMSGPVGREEGRIISRLAWPIALEQSLLILTGILSSMLYGGISGRALAAIGMGNMYILFIQSILMALPTGAIVLVARMTGADDALGARAAGEASAFLSVAISLGVVLLGQIFAPLIIRLTMPGADAELLADTLEYFRLLLYSFPGYLLYTVMGGVLRGKGDARTPMLISLVTNGGNLLLTLLLVSWLKLGLTGAGLALLISRTAGGVAMMLPQYSKHNLLHLTVKGTLCPQKKLCTRLLQVGLPTSIEQALVQGGYLVLNSMTVAIGTQAATVYQVVSSIGGIYNIPSVVFFNVTMTTVGQHLGGQAPEKARLSVRISMLAAAVTSLVLAVIVALLGKTAAGCYTQDPQVIALSAQALWIQVATILLVVLINVTLGALRSSGDMKFTLFAACFGVWLVRTPLLYYLCFVRQAGILGIYWSFLLDYGVRGGLYLFRYLQGKWVSIKV